MRNEEKISNGIAGRNAVLTNDPGHGSISQIPEIIAARWFTHYDVYYSPQLEHLRILAVNPYPEKSHVTGADRIRQNFEIFRECWTSIPVYGPWPALNLIKKEDVKVVEVPITRRYEFTPGAFSVVEDVKIYAVFNGEL